MKLEELPPNTLIESKEQGRYLASDDGTWFELYPHCVDCMLQVSNEGYEMPDSGQQVREPAAEFFGEYKVLSLAMEALA